MIPIKNVMLIDDNKLDLFVNQRILKTYHNNIRVIHYQNPLLALKYLQISLLKNNLNHFTRPNVLFLDINMPQCTGFEFLEKLIKQNQLEIQNLKIYILSSSTSPKDINKAKLNPICSGYINKPLTIEKLHEILNINKLNLNKRIVLKRLSI
ncbi:response regulator [Mariniflexile jejuense]|uniref:Response regulator n=1 Tax=Mariniflexile jejuense TaxID=1173582 RepID=A0ABW3JIL3_9FLAO